MRPKRRRCESVMSQSSQYKCVGRYTAGLLQQTQALSPTPLSFRVQLQMEPRLYAH